ncbi:hypothetical protein OG884_26420 [Streptosporangium sp. NBC_01755]|uniref:hypothetical protein n=1 Tax=Streptosporangium sp. NBC_01755 TaxID=2975949 RepID=UPI002DDB8C82|nr:hypothetical protein [Streptosporangium sp. NBC_01755]WSC98384.1 hypothetical protein OG884_26420 [Streptosporangium sp. NBC_01755]
MTYSIALPALARKAKPTAAERLATAAQAAADVRAHDTNPDVVAYRIERLRTRVDILIWTGLILGLLFTMATVQGFAAAGKTTFSIEWWIAWMLDPMVSLVLVGVLLGEQVIARHSIVAGAWVRRTKWTALALTYAMNTWQAWAELDPAAILLHSVPPAMVFCAAEAVTTLRLQITEAVQRAYDAAARTEQPVQQDTPLRTVRVARTFVYAAGPARTAPVRRALVFRTGSPAPVTRTVRRAFTFHAGAPTVEQPATPQPADRVEFAKLLTGEILAAAESGDRWGPDYAALMARSLRSKSWCEKRVKEARTAVFA